MKLEIKGISKSYGKIKALNNFSAQLTEGVYGLLGPNGSGKTTLISIITQLLSQDSGDIYFDGENVSELGMDYIKNLGYLPQYPKFYPNFTVCEFLKYICTMKNIPKSLHQEKINEVLKLVNLEEFSKMKISKLSGGMRQRLGIAQAIINEPKILILDEPTAGLDPQERIRFRNLIAKLSSKRIVLLSTHIVTDIEYIANKVLLLRNGQLITEKSPTELVNSISNKVWRVDVAEENIATLMDKNLISSAIYSNSSYTVKIISDKKPYEDATNHSPTLEDVYLYYFGELK